MNFIVDSGYKIQKTNRAIKKQNTYGITLPDLIVSPSSSVPEGTIMSRKVGQHGSPITIERLDLYRELIPTDKLTLLRIPTHIKTIEEAEKAGFYEPGFKDFLSYLITRYPNIILYSKSSLAQSILGTYLKELDSTAPQKRLVLDVNQSNRRESSFYLTKGSLDKMSEEALESGKKVICDYGLPRTIDESKVLTTTQMPYVAAREGLSQSLWVITHDPDKMTSNINQYIKTYYAMKRS